MERAKLNIQEFSEQVVAYETAQAPVPVSRVEGAIRVCEKLRRHLVHLIGQTGYHALISRTLELLSREAEWAQTIQIAENGSLWLKQPAGIQETPIGTPKDEAALPAKLLRLLATFIGEALTLNLAREVWPHLSDSKSISSVKAK